MFYVEQIFYAMNKSFIKSLGNTALNVVLLIIINGLLIFQRIGIIEGISPNKVDNDILDQCCRILMSISLCLLVFLFAYFFLRKSLNIK